VSRTAVDLDTIDRDSSEAPAEVNTILVDWLKGL